MTQKVQAFISIVVPEKKTTTQPIDIICYMTVTSFDFCCCLRVRSFILETFTNECIVMY